MQKKKCTVLLDQMCQESVLFCETGVHRYDHWRFERPLQYLTRGNSIIDLHPSYNDNILIFIPIQSGLQRMASRRMAAIKNYELLKLLKVISLALFPPHILLRS